MSGTAQRILIVAAIVVTITITRFLPFMLFPAGGETPKYIEYLGKSLPYAAMGLLVVYCLRGVSLAATPFGAPEILAIVAIILLHNWKGNSLLSIEAGTVFYMILVRVVFA